MATKKLQILGSIGNNIKNVKNYGATGDGITDDTVAIANAIAKLDNGDTLYFPEGVYRVSNINLKSDMKVQGDGWCSVIKLLDHTSDFHNNCLNIVGTKSNQIKNIFIRDIKLDGNRWADGEYKQASTGDSADQRLDGIHIRFASDIYVENVWMYNNGYHGCIMTYATNVVLDNCKVTDNGFRPIHGHTHIYNCRVSNCLCENNGLGVQGGSGNLNDSVFFFGSQYIVINDNIIKSNRRGCITVEFEQASKESADYMPTLGITISGNVCECYEDLAFVGSTESDTGVTKFSSQGIVVIGGPSELVNVAVTGNSIRNAHEAINIYSVQETKDDDPSNDIAYSINTTISGNTVIDCSFGVYAESVSDVIISDNQFKNLAIRWIYARNMENAVIQNNNVNASDISEAEMCRIIESKNVVIRDNHLVGNCKDAIYAPSSNSDLIVENNTIYGFLSANPIVNTSGVSVGNIIDATIDDDSVEKIRRVYENPGFVNPYNKAVNTTSANWTYTTPVAITDFDIRYELNNYVAISNSYTDPYEYKVSSYNAIVFMTGSDLTTAVGFAALSNGVGDIEFSRVYQPGNNNTWGYTISISAEQVKELFPSAKYVMFQTAKISSKPEDLAAWYQSLNDGCAYIYREKTGGGFYILTDDDKAEIAEIAAELIDAPSGDSGKSAYEYAQDGGYTGTEEEFAAKLAKEIPEKTSDLTNDSGFITDAGVPVKSVNNKTGAVSLSASDVGARSSDWMPTADNVGAVPVSRKVNGKALSSDISLSASDVGARPDTWVPTYADVGADKSGTAGTVFSGHNVNPSAHNDIRLLITELTTRLDALANSDDDTLDQMAEIVAYIKANRDLIEQVTTGKVSVSEIVDNLTTNVSNKPLSAAQGVALKTLIDAIKVPTKVSELTNDSKYLTSVPAEYVTESELTEKGYLTEHQDLSNYALKSEIPSVPVKSVNGKTGNVTLNATDVGALPSSTTIPSKTSQLQNDSGFITNIPAEYVTETELNAKGYLTQHQSLAEYVKTSELGTLAKKSTVAKTDLSSAVQTSLGKADTALQSYTETDPTVPSWAKAANKPTYTADEVGALSEDSLPDAINTALAQAKASGEFKGENGVSISSVKQTTTSSVDGGSNVVTVTLSDGTISTFTVKNGSKGSNGVSATHSWNGTTLTVTSASGTSSANLKGEKGDKGDPYTLTSTDKSAIVNAVIAALPRYNGEVL